MGDSKPRRARQDYIDRLIERNEDVDHVLRTKTAEKCLKMRSPQGRPTLMDPAKAKQQCADSKSYGSLNSEEIEQIEKRLDKTNPFIIPDNKKELYSLILDEINRRISSQTFQSTL